MSVPFLKHYYDFSITFNVILRSISGTDQVDSEIIFNILELPKIIIFNILELPKIVKFILK